MRTLLVAALAVWLGAASAGSAQTRDTVTIRGHAQTLHLYGSPSGEPVIVSSGDGGWMHVAPHVADVLSARGFYVIGFDVKAYLESFTGSHSALRPEEEPADYRVLADYALKVTGRKPLLVGVSEGAGLSVLAATDPKTQESVTGVIGLGLPDMNELAWRWKDSIIYLTHRAPDEPTFSSAGIIGHVAPVPFAEIHSTHDEYVPTAEIERVMAAAHEPKRLWMVNAANHRFSDNQAGLDESLLEAIAWVRHTMPR